MKFLLPILKCPVCKCEKLWMTTGGWYPQNVRCDRCDWKGTEDQSETGHLQAEVKGETK